MKIKKHGKLFKGSTEKDKYEQFKCENCGCEFSVKEDEYYKHSGSNFSASDSLTYTYSPVDTLVCSCPECYKICKKYDYYKAYYTTTSSSTITANGTATVDINNEVN